MIGLRRASTTDSDWRSALLRQVDQRATVPAHIDDVRMIDALLDSMHRPRTVRPENGLIRHWLPEKLLSLPHSMLQLVLFLTLVGSFIFLMRLINYFPLPMLHILCVGAIGVVVIRARQRSRTQRYRQRLKTVFVLIDKLPAIDAVPRLFRAAEIAGRVPAAGQQDEKLAALPESLWRLGRLLSELSPDELLSLPDDTKRSLRDAIETQSPRVSRYTMVAAARSRLCAAALVCLPHTLHSPDNPSLDISLRRRIDALAVGDESDPVTAAANECLRMLRAAGSGA